MAEKIYVLGKQDFENYVINDLGISDKNVEMFKGFAFISIVNGNYNPMEFDDDFFKVSMFNENHPNVLILQFDDVEHDSEHFKAFSKKQAQEVIEFIEKNKNKSFFIACAAGVSRSGAVGMFANGVLGYDFEDFKRRHPTIRPNARVTRMLNRIKYYSHFVKVQQKELERKD